MIETGALIVVVIVALAPGCLLVPKAHALAVLLRKREHARVDVNTLGQIRTGPG